MLERYLSYTGLFDFMDPKSFLGAPGLEKVDYRRWSRIGAELLTTGGYKLENGVLTLELRFLTSPRASSWWAGATTGAPRTWGPCWPVSATR